MSGQVSSGLDEKTAYHPKHGKDSKEPKPPAVVVHRERYLTEQFPSWMRLNQGLKACPDLLRLVWRMPSLCLMLRQTKFSSCSKEVDE